MKKYKSLIFRELKIVRKTHLSMLATMAGLMVMFVLATVFIVKKDLKEGETIEAFALMISYMCTMIMAAMSADDNDILKSDIVSGWRRYSLALPLTALEKTAAKHVIKLMVIIIAMVISILFSATVAAVNGIGMSPSVIFCFFITLDIFLIIGIIKETIISRAVDKKSLKKLGIIAGGVVIVILAVVEFLPDSDSETKLKAIFSELEKSNSPAVLNNYIDFITIPDTAGFIGIALAFVIFALSFLITLKNNERREV